MEKIKVGILGCTGTVGQKLISLLHNHPYFNITDIAASEKSAGHKFADKVLWKENSDIPIEVKELVIKNCDEELDAKILFSGLDSSVAGEVEDYYARKGYAVISNSANHRMNEWIPLVVPEINAAHFEMIKKQKEIYKYEGFIVTNPNCSTTILSLAIYPIYKIFGINSLIVTTMQAISGAGYPGVASMDILGNIIPNIKGEEDKIETEPMKIFGEIKKDKIVFADFKISALCNRVPVYDGHTLSVSFSTKKKISDEEVINSLNNYPSLGLPSSPEKIVSYFKNPIKPQPKKEIYQGNGMTVSVGNLRKCNVLDWKFTVLGHNTIRGAAGAAILNAEYLIKNNYIK